MRQAVATAAAALLLLGSAGRVVYAVGGPVRPSPGRGGDPRDVRCPEPNAPYYLYSFPVLISDDGGDQRAWMGWYYAAGCAFELDPSGRAKGKTYANLAVNEGSVDEESDWRRQVTAATLVPIEQALPPSRGIPSDLAALQVPEWNSLTTGFLYLGWRAPLPVAIPSYLAQDMEQVGFRAVPGQIDVLSGASRYIEDGNRILIDSSRGTVGANALIDWWDVHGQGEFYNWDPSGAAASNPNLAGGIMRIILRPVDWEARGARQIGTSGDEAEVQVTVRLAYSSTRRRTPVAWRWKGEGEWHDIGVADLDPYTEGPKTFRVPLPAEPQPLEVKVNPREDTPPHELTFSNNTAEVTITPPTAPPSAASCTGLNAGIDIKGNTWRTGDEVPVVFWTVRNTQGPSGPIPVRVTVSVGSESQSRTVSLAPGKGTSGQVLYVPGSPGTLTASLRAEVQGSGAGCRTTWTASDSASIIPPPPDVQWTKPDTGVRLWGWR